MGRGVLEGRGVSDGRGVSVEASVAVTEVVSVGAGAVTVWVRDMKAVFVGALVSAKVGGTEVEVELQAREAMINRIGKMSFRLMSKCTLHN